MRVARRPRRPPAPGLSRAARPAAGWSRLIDVVRRIPRGRVATYGGVAAAAGYPRAPRVAGWALHALPADSPVPWHRVVGAGGRLSLARLDPASAITQRLRLEREGVRFDARGRVELERFLWRGPRRAERARPAGRRRRGVAPQRGPARR